MKLNKNNHSTQIFRDSRVANATSKKTLYLPLFERKSYMKHSLLAYYGHGGQFTTETSQILKR